MRAYAYREGVLPSPVKVRGKAHFVSGVLSTVVVFWVGSGDGSETSGADARQPGAPYSLRDGGRVGCIADDSARGAQNGMAPLTVTGTEPKSPSRPLAWLPLVTVTKPSRDHTFMALIPTVCVAWCAWCRLVPLPGQVTKAARVLASAAAFVGPRLAT